MPDPEPTFTGLQISTAQTVLRRALGLEPERFSLPALIGLISPEIGLLRRNGQSDEMIADLIGRTTGAPVAPEAVRLYYHVPDVRGRPEPGV